VAKEKANPKVEGVAPRIGTLGPLTGINFLRTLPPIGPTTTLITTNLPVRAKKEVRETPRVKAVARIGLVTFPAITMAHTLTSLMTPLLNIPLNPLSGTLGRIKTLILILGVLLFSIRKILGLKMLCKMSSIYTA
jgi:hypothetical protein